MPRFPSPASLFQILCCFPLTPVVTCRNLSPVNQPLVPSYIMKSLKSLIQALALLIACALVLGALAYCFLQFFIGGAL